MSLRNKIICVICLSLLVMLGVVFAVIKVNASKGFEKVNVATGSIKQTKDYKLYEFGIEGNSWSEEMDIIVRDVAEGYADVLDFEYVDVTKNMTLSNFYAVETFPTYIIVDKDGKVKYRKNGIMTRDEFVSFVEQINN